MRVIFLSVLIIVAVVFFALIKEMGCCEGCVDDDCRECFRKRIELEKNGGNDDKSECEK